MAKDNDGCDPNSTTPTPKPELNNLSLPTNTTSNIDEDEFTNHLNHATHTLRTDFISGARQMADAALSDLSTLALLASRSVTCKKEFRAKLAGAAKALSGARPSMGAAVMSVVLRALEEVFGVWGGEKVEGKEEEEQEESVEVLADKAVCVIQGVLERRKETQERLNQTFCSYVGEYMEDSKTQSHISILTLSNSSTIRSALISLLTCPSLSNSHLGLTILESRPRCEGASLASSLLSQLSPPTKSRLSISIIPDCAIGTIVTRSAIDIVLLGADKISPAGDVSNKIGSLAAVTCVKYLGRKKRSHNAKGVKIVVVSDMDKICPRRPSSPPSSSTHTHTRTQTGDQDDGETPEHHPASELSTAWSTEAQKMLDKESNVDVFGEWFEWVDSSFVDAYVTEMGVLSAADVESVAAEVGELEERVFGVGGT